MTNLTEMLEEFDSYIDAHEPDRAKAEDKKAFVHEQGGKVPIFMGKIVVATAMKAARFRYE